MSSRRGASIEMTPPLGRLTICFSAAGSTGVFTAWLEPSRNISSRPRARAVLPDWRRRLAAVSRTSFRFLMSIINCLAEIPEAEAPSSHEVEGIQRVYQRRVSPDGHVSFLIDQREGSPIVGSRAIHLYHVSRWLCCSHCFHILIYTLLAGCQTRFLVF